MPGFVRFIATLVTTWKIFTNTKESAKSGGSLIKPSGSVKKNGTYQTNH